MATGASDRGLLVAVTVIWGLNFVSTRFGLDAMSPLGFRVVTFGAAALLLLILAPILRVSLRLPRGIDYLHLSVAGLCSIAAFGLLAAIALLHSPAGRTSIIVYTMPIWVALLSRVVLGETLGWRRGAATLIGIVGLGVLLAPVLFAGDTMGASGESGRAIGGLAALGAAVVWAIGTVYLKAVRITAPPLAITSWQLLAGTAALGIAALIIRDPVVIAPPTPLAWAGIIYTTLAGTVVAYLLWFRVVQRLPASMAGLGTLLVPVFGTIFGVVLLGERPGVADAIGFALVLIAGVLALGGRDERQ